MEKQSTTHATMPRLAAIALSVFDEVKRAQDKHPAFPLDKIHAAAIVAEEAGELVQASIDHEYSEACPERLREEAIQTAAMAFRFLFHLELSPSSDS
jgi:NTP pyrophosphatase (non-canonical NTP hydrolase)